jgi:patatin-like phospholipase/acyl hydrolase
MVEIGLATSAAPTIYRPLESGGYRLIDGGIWANNPTMLAVVEALIAYDVPRERIKVLSIGCGDEAIAKREDCSARKVNMTISLAFLAPDLVKAAIEGRLPRGMGVARLCDMPAEWSRQRQMLGLTSAEAR